MRWCEVCERELWPIERLNGFLRPLGIARPGGGARVRWVCGRCLRRLQNQGPRRPVSVVPERASVALQRNDLQWFAGWTEDGTPLWVSSRRKAMLFEDEHVAREPIARLREQGHRAHPVVVFR